MPITAPSASSTGLSEDGCAPSCASRKSAQGRAFAAPTINAGQMPSSRKPGCSRFTRPSYRRDSLDEETTDWRAVCEKTACTVRREGVGASRSLPLSVAVRRFGQSLLICATSNPRGGAKRNCKIVSAPSTDVVTWSRASLAKRQPRILPFRGNRAIRRPSRSRRGGGWNWVGVVSGLFNPNDSGVGALERRPRHDEGYHEGGGCGRRSFAFG